MVVSIIIGIIILAIVIFVAIRIVKNILIGLALIGLILLASFLILGAIPNLRSIPIIGPRLPRFPSSLGEVVSIIKRIFYEIKILDVSRDSENRLLITIKNTGKLKASNFSVFVDNKTVKIINKPKDPLESGEITTIQTDWKMDYSEILVQSLKVNVTIKNMT
jgi:hypothetical protein